MTTPPKDAKDPTEPNREQRRALEFGRQHAAQDARATQQERKLGDSAAPPDVADPRAKSTGHGKKTADKWNQ